MQPRVLPFPMDGETEAQVRLYLLHPSAHLTTQRLWKPPGMEGQADN